MPQIEMTLTTPALLFPAISLLLLAYTNRFLVLAQLIRQLSRESDEGRREDALRQIQGLKTRISLIKAMQIFGVLSFLCCASSMFALFLAQLVIGELFFGISLIGLSISLILSLSEIAISTNALKIELESVQHKSRS
jgi:hypothetical protein